MSLNQWVRGNAATGFCPGRSFRCDAWHEKIREESGRYAGALTASLFARIACGSFDA